MAAWNRSAAGAVYADEKNSVSDTTRETGGIVAIDVPFREAVSDTEFFSSP
jgi:hypothetical protein